MASAPAQGLAAHLCPELIDAILQHVVWPADLRALALLSRRWHLCATPRLYATLPVISSRPASTLALLALLETDAARAACVRTVVFDEFLPAQPGSALFDSDGDALSSSSSFLPWRGRRPKRRPRPATETHYITKHVPLFPIGQYLVLRDVALALDRVLPVLPNLRSVQMRHVHPLLMTFYAGLSRRPTKRLLVKPWRHNLRSYLDIFPVGEILTTWAALSQAPSYTFSLAHSHPHLHSHSHSASLLKLHAASTNTNTEVRRIEHLSTRLWSRCAPPPTALLHLHTLALTGAGFRDWSAARDWAPALSAPLPFLTALLLSDLQSGELGELLTGGLPGAPHLRTLVLSRVSLQAWEYRVLAQLVRSHAGTLETLCLDARWAQGGFENGPLWAVFFDAGVNGEGYTWIHMPKLRALRIHNLAGFTCTQCALSTSPISSHGPAREADSGLYPALLAFLRSHALVELGITGLPAEERIAFDELGRDLPVDRLTLYGGGVARSTGTPPAASGDILEKEIWLRDVFLLRGTPFEGAYWDAPVPRGRLRRPHPMQPV